MNPVKHDDENENNLGNPVGNIEAARYDEVQTTFENSLTLSLDSNVISLQAYILKYIDFKKT